MQNKYIKFLTSLKFGIILFLIIAIYSIIGTVIPQGMANEMYLQQYKTFGNLMMLLQFNQVYSSIIFRIIVLLFVVNLVGCTLNILPAQLNRMKNTYFPSSHTKNENLWEEGTDLQSFKKHLKKNRFSVVDREDGFYAAKHRIGNIGSSVTHLGIIIIILGGFIGNLFATQGFFNLMPNEMKTFEKQNFSVVLDDFYLGFREDGTTEQYYSEFSIFEDGKKVKAEKIWVNNPLSYKGLELFQSSFGWVNKLVIKDKDDSVVYEGLLKDDQHYFYQPEHLTVYLYGFFPDFDINQMGQPFTKSQKMVSPHYAVVFYNFNEYVESYIIEPGQPITYNDVKVEFVEPTLYTGITYRKDFGYYFVLLGCLILMSGLMLSFYFYPKYILITPNSILPITRQNSWGYNIQVKGILEKSQNQSKGDI